MRTDPEKFVDKVNTYWQTTMKEQKIRPFWEQAAYHIGNLATAQTFKNTDYLTFTKEWSEKSQWKGHPKNIDKENWTWGYGEEETDARLFADWHACFQVYLTLFEMDEKKHPEWIKQAQEVINYQVSTLDDSYWWWADGLFMGMPVMTKFYQLTKDVKYLTKMHEYFLFSLELMYDGENGIPTNENGYTSSAYVGGPYGGKKATISNFSNPDNYQHLFYRDASFAFPANPLPGKWKDEKNFWARGNGWVVAALIRVLRELPDNWPHKPFYQQIFKQMAQAIKECQQVDDAGNGYWTQSLLVPDFSRSADNTFGYETSGSAFFTFALLAGINDGLLPADEYQETALKGWDYLSNVALHENGKIGYVQPVGGAAGKAASYENTQDFGVGASLLAACELFKMNKN